MKVEHLYALISAAIFITLFYLFYKIISPFLIPIAWAIVLSIVFYPVYKLILKFVKRPWAASFITLIIILVFVIGSFSFILSALVEEITHTYSSIENRGVEVITNIQKHPAVSKLFEKINSYTEGKGVDLNQAAITSLKAVGKYIGEHVSVVFKDIIIFAISFLIMCLTTFFFLKDGNHLVDYIKNRLPFIEGQKEQLELRVREMVIAVIYGGLAVGVMQGLIGGLTFYLLGLPAPVLWGSAMALLALIPVFGAGLIWGPASIILIMGGSYGKGIALILVGFLVISMIDNVLRPMIIGDRTRLHMLLVLFSVLGGIQFFGFIGFVLGPLIVALCLSLLEIYKPDEVESTV
ncbi:MAG TPA: AI-2E family transporter [Nitrospirae bacterium]|nr:AI-2E family transporter [Nitrospirota bacterium]